MERQPRDVVTSNHPVDKDEVARELLCVLMGFHMVLHKR